MPEIVKSVFKPAPNIDILNAVRGFTSNEYQERIPESTKANIQENLNMLAKNSGLRNQFATGLINQIGLVLLRETLQWDNPLAFAKMGMLEDGESIEEVMVGLIKSIAYDADRDSLEKIIFGRESPEVAAYLHHVTREDIYKTTIDDVQLKKAFRSQDGLSKFIVDLMTRLQTSDQVDEFLIMTNLFSEAYRRGLFFKVQTEDIGALTSDAPGVRSFLRQAKELAATLQFPSRNYNRAHMTAVVRPEDLILFMTPAASAAIDVEALAASFNLSKSELVGKIVIVPATNFRIPGVQAILTTKNFFIAADTVYETRSVQNPAGLYDNHFLHRQGIYSVSMLAPAILFWTGEGDTLEELDTPVTSISDIIVNNRLDAPVTTLPRGDFYQVNVEAITNPADGNNSGVLLELLGSLSPFTRLEQSGALFVSLDDAAVSLTITATAQDNYTVVKTRTLNLTGEIANTAPGKPVDEAVVIP